MATLLLQEVQPCSSGQQEPLSPESLRNGAFKPLSVLAELSVFRKGTAVFCGCAVPARCGDQAFGLACGSEEGPLLAGQSGTDLDQDSAVWSLWAAAGHSLQLLPGPLLCGVWFGIGGAGGWLQLLPGGCRCARWDTVVWGWATAGLVGTGAGLWGVPQAKDLLTSWRPLVSIPGTQQCLICGVVDGNSPSN